MGAGARPPGRGARPADRRAGDGGTARRLLPERADAGPADAGHRAGGGADWRREGTAADGDRARAPVTSPPRPGVPGPIGVVAHYNLLEPLEPSGPGDLYPGARHAASDARSRCGCCPPTSRPDAAARAALMTQARVDDRRCRIPTSSRSSTPASTTAASTWCSSSCKGQSLRAEMAGRPLNVRRAVETAIQIADAIAAAHATGLRARRPEPRVGVDHRARPRQGAGVRAGGARRDSPSPIDAAARLRLARGDAGPGARRPVRHLLGRRDPLRDAHRPTPEPARVAPRPARRTGTCRKSWTS